jgi:hypothetical protein
MSFSSRLSQWLYGAGVDRPGLEAGLRGSYRAAWEGGNANEMSAAMVFVALAEEERGYDLILDALKKGDSLVAQEALVCVTILAERGIQLHPDIRRLLREIQERLPDTTGLVLMAEEALG